MVTVPADTPVTIPVLPTVATPGVPLVHTPPGVGSASGVVVAVQIDIGVAGVIAAGAVLTVIGAVAVHVPCV